MPDPVLPVTDVAIPILPPHIESFIPGPWEASVAGKKIVWALGKFAAANAAAPTLSAPITLAIIKISNITAPYGVSISVDQEVFDRALPFLLFAAFVALHDYAKMKTKLPWL